MQAGAHQCMRYALCIVLQTAVALGDIVNHSPVSIKLRRDAFHPDNWACKIDDRSNVIERL